MRRFPSISRIIFYLFYFRLLFFLVFSAFLLHVDSCNVHLCLQEFGRFNGPKGDPRKKDQVSALAGPLDTSQDYCTFAEALSQCTKVLSKSCRGDLNYHTIITLIKQSLVNNNCSVNQKSKAQKAFMLPVNMLRRKENSRRIKKCLRDAHNYSTNQERFAHLKDRRQNRTLYGYTRKSGQLFRGGQHRSRNQRQVGDSIDYDNQEALDSRSGRSHKIPKESVSSQERSSKLSCVIYGHPHLKTFQNQYQTCMCKGAWPLLEHPLFAIQLTNSLYNDGSVTASGITKVTILIRQFHSCDIPHSVLFEAEESSLPSTFNDGTSSTANNLLRLETVSEDLVTVHLDHLGIKVVVSSFDRKFFNVAVTMKTSLAIEQLVDFGSALSDHSLCKAGCPTREQIDLNHYSSAQFNKIKSNSSRTASCEKLLGYYKAACLYELNLRRQGDIRTFKFGQNYDGSAEDNVYVEYLNSHDYYFNDFAVLCATQLLIFVAFFVNINF